MNIDLWEKISILITQGKLEESINYLESNLASCKSNWFKSLIGSDFTNDPVEIAEEINEFIHSCELDFNVRSIYLEMNGFDINPDRWYFDFFAYDTYAEDAEDLDWLSDWDSEIWPEITLEGLEEIQNDFDWYNKNSGFNDALAQEANEYAVLLVMCKFANLIGKAVATDKIKKGIPVLATAHDFDIIPRFIT